MIPIEVKINRAFYNRHPSECRVIVEMNRFGRGTAKLDSYLSAKKLNSCKGKWRKIEFGQAKAIVIDLISKSICYGSEVVPIDQAQRWADHFFKEFEPGEAEYYTNLIIEKYPIPISVYRLGSYQNENILPDYLISLGVACLDSYKIGIFVRGEWD